MTNLASNDVSAREPIRVAVVGGGCAGLTAAFELSRPEHEGRYAVTVYQLGWRLGGKGASGRGVAGRIEEHGLHLWMGFYENAFRIVRECYAELERDPRSCPIASWTDAFVPDPACGVTDRTPDGRWLPWTVALGSQPGLPGDPLPPGHRYSVAHYVGRSLGLLGSLLRAVRKESGKGSAAPPPASGAEAELSRQISELMKYGELATLTAVIQGLSLLEARLRALPLYPNSVVLPFYEAVARGAKQQLDALVQTDDEMRRLWEIIDLVLAAVRGSLRFSLLSDPRGFDVIDDYDCREWLKLNGASERAINSAFIRGLYDLAFAYEEGDVRRPRVAAGQALRGTMRAFYTYRGAFFWKMQVGMGDAVFAPLYEVLKRRGVQFEFFHRLEQVLLGPAPADEGGKPHVARLVFDVQAVTRDGREYNPLVDVKGVPSFPSAPDHAQLEDGEQLARSGRDFESFWERERAFERTLQVGRDFDLVVLAVSVASIPHVCKDIVENDARWRDMVEHVKTVPTQALQLWLDADLRELGWEHGPMNLSGFVEPFDTWADMGQLIDKECWSRPPKTIAYFCSVLPDRSPAEQRRPSYPGERLGEVRANAIAFMDGELGHLWSKARSPAGGFRWELLGSADGARALPADSSRIDSQYYRANINPSDRYVLSLPGSLRYRISPLDTSYDNLTIAGDWTDCGFNEGCVEAAVMSGRLAAHALSLKPALEDIVGFDHP